ncbi:DMT family transporter [Paraburkholderia rhizosphaerae]|uniref:Threonine/homoserine efflux transporter RhtA n=1 Tax=Paraburkholderia rhizosphaerae TaxID=480658 RepID=A0A4R8LXB3_9BURK|nr:DMT family transporter [Paraburkholderia rhizosphaerae]TDY52846.1 threonine/homoserine efflux transporter RhtA [Paraburkholderia rhizosphaerae]
MSVSVARPHAVNSRSIVQILLSMFCFALVDALAKTVALHYPANVLTFFRMLFGLAPAIAMCMYGTPLRERIRTLNVRRQTVRALTLLVTLGLFFAGLPYVPLSEAVAILYSESLFVIVLAPLLLKETLRRRDAAAAAIGFIGVLLIVRPNGNQASWLGPLLLILSAITGALSIIQIKHFKPTEDSSVAVLYFTLIGTLVSGMSLLFLWRTPTLDALALMALIGILAGTGQILMTVAFRNASASALAPYNYTSIVWATLFGYLAWGETIGLVSVAGIALVVGSSIAVALRGKTVDAPPA